MNNNAIYLLSWLYLFLAIIYTTIEIFYINRCKEIKVITLIRGMYCIIYGYTPAILHSYVYNYGYFETPYNLIDYSSDGIYILYILMVLSIVGYMSINFGYFISNKKSKKFLKKKKQFKEVDDESLFKAGVFMLLVGTTSLILWSNAYGGPIRVLEYADQLRAGFIDTYNPWSVLMRFCPLTSFATYIFASLWVKNKCKFKYIFFATVGAIVTTLYNLASSSRLQFILFFTILIIVVNETKRVYLNKKINISKYIILCIVALIFMSSAESIMSLIQTGKRSVDVSYNISIFKVLREEFFFPTISGQTSIEAHNNGVVSFRIIKDLFSGILAWLPSRFRPDSIQRLEALNTYLIYGTTMYGYMPTDLISVSIYDLGYVGIIFIPATLGYIAKKVDNFFKYRDKNSYTIIIYTLISFYFVKGIAYSDIANIMLNIFFIVIGIIIVNFTLGLKKFKI